VSDNYRDFDDTALRSAALIVWNARKKTGRWAEPDASQIAREVVWLDRPERAPTQARRGDPMTTAARLSFPWPPCTCRDALGVRTEGNPFGHYASCPRQNLRLPCTHGDDVSFHLWVWRVVEHGGAVHYVVAGSPDDAFTLAVGHFLPESDLTQTRVEALTWQELLHTTVPRRGTPWDESLFEVAAGDAARRDTARYLHGPDDEEPPP